MNTFIQVIGILVLVAIAWTILAAMFRSWLGSSETADAEADFHNEQAGKTCEREALLSEAIATGDYRKYNETRARHEKEFTEEIRRLVDQETCIDERTQWELDHNVNPYRQAPAPRGKLVRR